MWEKIDVWEIRREFPEPLLGFFPIKNNGIPDQEGFSLGFYYTNFIYCNPNMIWLALLVVATPWLWPLFSFGLMLLADLHVKPYLS